MTRTTRSVFLGLLLSALLTVGSAAPARAAAPPTAAPVAAVWSGAHGRTRVIQVAVAGMCVALFVMMRKFTDTSKH